MKKIAAILLCVCMLLTLPVFAFAMQLGDIDGNGKVSAADARLALRAAVGLAVYTQGSDQFTAADVNQDGRVTASDARIILRAAVGLQILTTNPSPPTDKTKLSSSEIYSLACSYTFEIRTQMTNGYAIGSGFAISDDGKIVTNYHVIEDGQSITATSYYGETFQVVQILAYDADIDLAVLKINAMTDYAELNKTDYNTGDKIYTLGSSNGLTGTFSDGVIAQKSRPVQENGVTVNYIQITAPISHGNSGGPLIDEYGRVLGANTWTYVDGQNLNFSVPVYYLDQLNYSRPVSVAQFAAGTAAAEFSLEIPMTSFSLRKGAMVLIPISVNVPAGVSEYTLTVSKTKNSALRAEMGEWSGNSLILYVFADDYVSSETMSVYVKGYPETEVTLRFSVSSSNTISFYIPFSSVPDFGVMTGVAPMEKYEAEDFSTFGAVYEYYSLYYAGFTSPASMRSNYFSMLQAAGFTLSETDTSDPYSPTWYFVNSSSGDVLAYGEIYTDSSYPDAILILWN